MVVSSNFEFHPSGATYGMMDSTSPAINPPEQNLNKTQRHPRTLQAAVTPRARPDHQLQPERESRTGSSPSHAPQAHAPAPPAREQDNTRAYGYSKR